MRLLRVLRAYASIAKRGRRNQTDLVRYLARRPALLLANWAYETALVASNRVEPRVKTLAVTKAASLTGCPF